ncbi:MAG: HEPN domain-containing protein [bacterium]
METVIKKNETANERLAAFVRNPLRPLIENMTARIVAEYHPEQIILYGSQTTGKARPGSDIDLFLVKQTNESFVARCAAVKRIVQSLRSKAPVSPLVLNPDEVRKRLSRGDQFIQQIIEQGIHLYHHRPDRWSGDLSMAVKRKDSLYPKDWLRVADRDWQRVEKRLVEGDQEDAGFRLQQALEKYLKAFLLASGWELDKTHDLSKLLEEAIKHKTELDLFVDLCQRVENYYMVDRYPSELDAGISLEEVEKDFTEAHRLRAMILTKFIPTSTSTMPPDQPDNKAARKPRQAKTKRIRKKRQ